MAGTLRGTDAWFRNPRSKVSAHYGVGRGGAVHQYVSESDTAWHAGRVYRPTWGGVKRLGRNPNLYTVGIEHEGHLGDAWPEAMLDASARLIADVCTRWSIPIDREHVVGHREIYARKACPGDEVDLDDLVARARAAAGLDGGAGGRYNFVDDPGEAVTRVALNVREAPTSRSRRLRTEPAGARLAVAGWTSNGEAVHANAHWYRLGDGRYVWAGGTRSPVPGL